VVRRYLGYILAAGIAATAVIMLLAEHNAPKPGESQQTARDDLAEVRRVAESGIRSSARNPDAVRFRGGQIYPQAAAGQVAVCGQTDVSGGFVPFVAVIRTSGDGFVHPYQVVEIHVAATIRDADRTYIETVARCWPGGGPQARQHGSITAVPPLPEHPDAVLRTAAPVAAPPAPASQPAFVVQPRVAVAPVPPSASAVPPAAAETEDADEAPAGAIRTVTMRQDANIRTVPHGNAVGVAPRGSSLRVFSEAPGGWLEVGETAPFGWVHGSMVEQR
jgi:hypothetical protein